MTTERWQIWIRNVDVDEETLHWQVRIRISNVCNKVATIRNSSGKDCFYGSGKFPGKKKSIKLGWSDRDCVTISETVTRFIINVVITKSNFVINRHSHLRNSFIERGGCLISFHSVVASCPIIYNQIIIRHWTLTPFATVSNLKNELISRMSSLLSTRHRLKSPNGWRYFRFPVNAAKTGDAVRREATRINRRSRGGRLRRALT